MVKKDYNKNRLNIDFHLVETCSPYKIWRDDGKRYTVYTVRIVNGPKPPEIKQRGRR